MKNACFALLLFFCMLACGCNLANFAVLWPPHGPQQAEGLQRRIVKLEGKEVEVWVAKSANGEKPTAYALRFYGNADRAEWNIANDAVEYPDVEFWGVNYPGYGGSDGPATLRGVGRAAIAVFDELAREARGRPIYAVGTSLGTTAALHVASQRDVRGLVLVNPPPLRRLVLEEYGWWNLWLLAGPTALMIPEDLDSEENARRCHVPAVFVMSDRDEIVPIAQQGHIIRAYGGPKEVVLLAGASHNDGPSPAEMSRIKGAIAEMMRRPSLAASSRSVGP